MPFAWGETKPGDSDIVSQHPADERATRAVVKAFANVEHDQAEGRHKFGIGNTAARDAISTWVDGSIWFNTTDARRRLNVRVSGTWEQGGQEFEAGTIVVFHQNAAPVGWVRVLTEQADKVMMMTDGDMVVGGAWAISGLSSETADHTHTFSTTTGTENQNHTHNVVGTTSGKTGGTSQGTSASGGASTPLDDHTHSISFVSGVENQAHNHNLSGTTSGISGVHTHVGDGTWRPAYVTFMAAAKQ